MNRRIGCIVLLCGCMSVQVLGNDWPYWRGPEQNGMSKENAIVTHWSEGGENILWKAPFGGRTTPIVIKDRMYAITPVGEGPFLQERVICLNSITGKQIWEYRFNVFHSDIVENRIGWTSLVGDRETGYIYAHGTGGEFICFDRDGKIIWKRSLTEELGRISGYGGRLHTPILDEDRVIISIVFILSRYETGKQKSGHLYIAFDKKTGDVIWESQPGGKPLDTTYSVPAVAVIGGHRQLIAANADGNVYGMNVRSGEKLWTYRLSKRGLNSSIVVDGDYAYVTHSEENLTGTDMGALVCIDASKMGDITDTGTVWRINGFQAGYSSPALANHRLYVATNSGTLNCFNAKTGDKFWEYDLGTVMKGSPIVTKDGIIYVGEVNGKFHILKDMETQCQSLDFKEFTRPDGLVVEILGSPAFANGRTYFMTRYDTYCLGDPEQKGQIRPTDQLYGEQSLFDQEGNMRSFKPQFKIVPGEFTLKPGETINLKVHMYDEYGVKLTDNVLPGNSVPETSEAPAWHVEGVAGEIGTWGEFKAYPEPKFSAGTITYSAGMHEAKALVRIVPDLPINENFDGMKLDTQPPGWIGVDGKTKLVEKDGSVVLQKLATSPSAMFARMRCFTGLPIEGGYTVMVDMLGSPKEGRDTLSDMGLINTRYNMILLGKEKQIRLVSWAPIPRVQKEVPLDWQPDVWYRTKCRVDVSEKKAVVRGKVWPRDQEEPTDWMIEMIDPCPNREGSPGLYAYSKGTSAKRHGAPIFFDNYRVMKNDE